MLPKQLPTSIVTKNASILSQLRLDFVTCPLLEGSPFHELSKRAFPQSIPKRFLLLYYTSKTFSRILSFRDTLSPWLRLTCT